VGSAAAAWREAGVSSTERAKKTGLDYRKMGLTVEK
jgi:hypothetical protein